MTLDKRYQADRPAPRPARARPAETRPIRLPTAMSGRAMKSNLINTLGCEIVRGDFPEGALLPIEAVMLERYTVSRTALREAYSKLTAKGLVSARPKVGTTVLPRTGWNMLDPDVLNWHLQTKTAQDLAVDLFAVRRMVEPAAAELAARTRTDEDMAEIAAALARMEANAANESALIAADLAFHSAILQATHNPFVNAFSALIHAAMLCTFQQSWRGAEVNKVERLGQHAAVGAAIGRADPMGARRSMEHLLDESIRDVKRALAAT